MRIHAFASALCLALCGWAGSAVADMRQDVSAAYEDWDGAFNSGDAKAVAAFYAEDAKLLPPTHTILTGPAEIEKFFAGLFEAGITGHNLEVIEVGGDDDLAYAAANWTAKGKASDGAAQEVGGIATHIFERQDDGSLKLKLHTFN